MRIPTLLQKIGELAEQPDPRTTIDVDLMLDYTRVLYADLLEWRAKLAVPVAAKTTPIVMPAINEPTLAELAEAMNEDEEADDDESPDTPGQATLEFPATPGIARQLATSKAIQPAAGDIRSLISINEKYQIMSELFGNDKAAYEDALNHINDADDDEAALKWLQERLWVTEERSEAALGFYDLVRRFKSQ